VLINKVNEFKDGEKYLNDQNHQQNATIANLIIKSTVKLSENNNPYGYRLVV
jgi:hypothetical protein